MIVPPMTLSHYIFELRRNGFLPGCEEQGEARGLSPHASLETKQTPKIRPSLRVSLEMGNYDVETLAGRASYLRHVSPGIAPFLAATQS